MTNTRKRAQVVSKRSGIGAPSISVYTSGDWDAYWDSHMKLERKRLYGDTLIRFLRTHMLPE